MQKTKSKPRHLAVMAQFPAIAFAESDVFFWSAADQTVYYDPSAVKTERGLHTLIHELGHALLNHKTFVSGAQLLSYEVAAWEKAKELAAQFNITIPTEHIEDCLDSYRNWLHRRSRCPSCSTISTEVAEDTYRCFNCAQRWTVPTDQRSRCYRLKTNKSA